MTQPHAHPRIRKFNTRQTYPEQQLDNDLCQAVVAGKTVYLRGQIGQDLDTRASVGVGDAAAQAEKAMANVAMLLRECGSDLSHICKVTVYLVDVRYREAVYNRDGPVAQGRVSRVHRPGGIGAGAAGMAGRDRRDRRHSRLTGR